MTAHQHPSKPHECELRIRGDWRYGKCKCGWRSELVETPREVSELYREAHGMDWRDTGPTHDRAGRW
jgi:hypothetical protein